MKEHAGRIIGDVFFYCFVVISVISISLVLFTPARSFVYNELKKLADIRGKDSGPLRFKNKISKFGFDLKDLKPELIIKKRSRELAVVSENFILATYPIGLGKDPHGIKLKRNDGKTPEGLYYICKKDDSYKYHLFLQINYPAPDDAKRGSVQQILKPGEEKQIVEAWNKHKVPPQKTALGGPLGIHGFGAESNWTEDGSIAMHNYHLEEIYWILATGTPVAIIP